MVECRTIGSIWVDDPMAIPLTVQVLQNAIIDLPSDMLVGTTDRFGDFEAMDSESQFEVRHIKGKRVLSISVYNLPDFGEEPD
jgi:hypothetical protein